MEYSVEGCNYGEVTLNEKTLECKSVVSKKRIFDLDLSNISQCVVPLNNANDLEIQFADVHKKEKKEDCLVQITFHFPQNGENEEDEDEEDAAETAALKLQQQIMDSGILKTTTNDVIVEFTKDQGNFTFPRGKYGLQFTPTLMVMQGAQYSFRVAHANIENAYMLNKTEDRKVFVLQLVTAIRQGNQKYKCLVLETHNVEETVQFNLPKETMSEQYGINDTELTSPMANIFGKVFQSIGGIKVLVTKFESSSGSRCVRCSIKASEGLLFPAAKCFIFITKPTIIVKFDDIESIEFLRYDNTKNSATRNFDMKIRMKTSAKDVEKDYTFSSMSRVEYSPLLDFIESKEIPIINRVQPSMEMAIDGEDEDEDEEDDDYNSDAGSDNGDGSGSGSGSGSEDGSGSESGEESEKEVNKSKHMKVITKKKEKSVPKTTQKRKASEESGGKEKKKRQKKDKNAPKRGLTAYLIYSNSIRAQVMKENPGIKVTDVSKEIAAKWKLLGEQEKAPFEESAKKDKLRYTEQMKEYKQKAKETDGADSS